LYAIVYEAESGKNIIMGIHLIDNKKLNKFYTII